MNHYKFSAIAIAAVFSIISSSLFSQVVLNTPGTESKLYLSDAPLPQPLVVGLGGSEGGNAWASNYWQATRDAFLKKRLCIFSHWLF